MSILAYSCLYDDLPDGRDLTVELRWIGYPGESREDFVTGLTWNLSYLGATLPEGCMTAGLVWRDASRFALDISRLGFDKQADQAWSLILSTLRQSEEYRFTGAIDAGRFVALTLNSSAQYYAITGAAATFEQFRSHYTFRPDRVGILTSSVARGSRVIELPSASGVLSMAFIAHEAVGSLDNLDLTVSDREVFDFMDNGQMRFAVYDKDGRLKAASDTSVSLAGKPAKCLWCHEIDLQVNRTSSSPVAGYLSPLQLSEEVARLRAIIDDYRSEVESEIDFSKAQDHTLGELIYLSFMHPSPERLAEEWQIPVEEVETRMGAQAAHAYSEFPFLGNRLFRRSSADLLGPYPVFRSPDHERDFSPYEPTLIPQ